MECIRPIQVWNQLLRHMLDKQWENNLRTYIAIDDYKSIQVVSGGVKLQPMADDEGHLTLVVSAEAVKDTFVDDHFISFTGRFSGQVSTLKVPLHSIFYMFDRDGNSEWDIQRGKIVDGKVKILTNTMTAEILAIVGPDEVQDPEAPADVNPVVEAEPSSTIILADGAPGIPTDLNPGLEPASSLSGRMVFTHVGAVKALPAIFEYVTVNEFNEIALIGGGQIRVIKAVDELPNGDIIVTASNSRKYRIEVAKKYISGRQSKLPGSGPVSVGNGWTIEGQLGSKVTMVDVSSGETITVTWVMTPYMTVDNIPVISWTDDQGVYFSGELERIVADYLAEHAKNELLKAHANVVSFADYKKSKGK